MYCELHLFSISARSTSAMTTTAVAYLSLMGISIPVPYDLAEKSITCNYLVDSSCPVNDGDILLYTLNFHIESLFPVVSIIV